MAINFPTGPTVGDLYTFNGVIYRWDGTFWAPVQGGPTAVGDANYTILPTDGFVYTSVGFTAPRTWTLPLASAYRAGRPLTISDMAGTFYQPLTVQHAGSDTIGSALTAVVMGLQYQSMTVESDGISKWLIVAASPQALASTGDLKPTHKSSADPGWIMWSDGTIGDVSSGSSIRANYDTASLFSLYYGGYSDADCPILTSGGGATTRAAPGGGSGSWPVAFTTNQCRISLPKGAGRSLGLAGSGAGLTARGLGATAGAETETPTQGKTALHVHDYSWIVTLATGMSGAGIGGWSSLTTGTTANNTSGGTTNLNILDPSTYVNIMIKL